MYIRLNIKMLKCNKIYLQVFYLLIVSFKGKIYICIYNAKYITRKEKFREKILRASASQKAKVILSWSTITFTSQCYNSHTYKNISFYFITFSFRFIFSWCYFDEVCVISFLRSIVSRTSAANSNFSIRYLKCKSLENIIFTNLG